jgi:hypothetical protein
LNQALVIPDIIYASSAARRLAGPPYPACLRVFTDQGSFWHVVIGVIAGVVPEPFNLGTAALFTGYELSKGATGETIERTSGKFVEFGLGLVLAGVIRVLGDIR